MPFEVLVPVKDVVLASIELIHKQSLGKHIKIHSRKEGLPDLTGVDIAIVGLLENRGDVDIVTVKSSFSNIRREFYKLFPGNWHTTIADLGDIEAGQSLTDTYYAIRQLTEVLIKKNILLIYLGGTQDLTYPIYRAFDNLDQMVNVVNIDSRFDIGDSMQPISNKSFVGKMIVEEPYNLFNYSNIGFQTYLISQEEIDLMNKLYFDAIRLGEVSENISFVEPAMRDADIVSLDLNVLETSYLGGIYDNPNGLRGREVCAIARYAGISDKVSVFGIFQYLTQENLCIADTMIAQLMWYFVEGVNYRVDEQLSNRKTAFVKYSVPVEDEVLVFYKSDKTERWWMEVPYQSLNNTKLKREALLPCNYKDYLDACDQIIPERWYNCKRKNEI